MNPLETQFTQAYADTLDLYLTYNSRVLQEIAKPKDKRNKSLIEGQHKLATTLNMMSAAFAHTNFHKERVNDIIHQANETLEKKRAELDGLKLKNEGLSAENQKLKQRIAMLEQMALTDKKGLGANEDYLDRRKLV